MLLNLLSSTYTPWKTKWWCYWVPCYTAMFRFCAGSSLYVWDVLKCFVTMVALKGHSLVPQSNK